MHRLPTTPEEADRRALTRARRSRRRADKRIDRLRAALVRSQALAARLAVLEAAARSAR